MFWTVSRTGTGERIEGKRIRREISAAPPLTLSAPPASAGRPGSPWSRCHPRARSAWTPSGRVAPGVLRCDRHRTGRSEPGLTDHCGSSSGTTRRHARLPQSAHASGWSSQRAARINTEPLVAELVIGAWCLDRGTRARPIPAGSVRRASAPCPGRCTVLLRVRSVVADIVPGRGLLATPANRVFPSPEDGLEGLGAVTFAGITVLFTRMATIFDGIPARDPDRPSTDQDPCGQAGRDPCGTPCA